jgi:IS6 family transposase
MVKPRTITVEKNPACPKVITEKESAELWRFSRLRQVKFLNKSVVSSTH